MKWHLGLFLREHFLRLGNPDSRFFSEKTVAGWFEVGTRVAMVCVMDIHFLVENAGLLLWPLVALSVACLAAIVERGLFFARGGGEVEGPDPQMSEFAGQVGFPEGKEQTRWKGTAGGRLLLMICAWHRKEKNSLQVDAAVRQEFQYLEKKLGLFDFTIVSAPLLGILGTVVGLVVSFQYSGSGPSGLNSEALAGGVAQSLATSILGLVLAVLAILARHFYGTFASRASQTLSDYLERLPLEASALGGQK